MTEPITIEQLKNANLDAVSLQTFASDPEPKDVKTRQGAVYPNLAKITKLLLEQGLTNAKLYPSYAAMTADNVADGTHAIVTDDADSVNNGYWRKKNSNWEYLAYNPAKQIADALHEFYTQAYRNFVIKSNNLNYGLVAAVVDAEGNHTWLQANATDGGMTDIAEREIREKLKLQSNTTPFATFVLTDQDGNITDLWLDNDGKISDRVIKSWHERMQKLGDNVKSSNQHLTNIKHILPELSVQNVEINKNDVHYRDGELLPIYPDNDRIVLIGSSSLDNSQAEIEPALKLINPELEFYNPCFGGSMSNQLSAMYGSVPIKLKFDSNIIKASGASRAVITNDVVFNHLRMTMTGWVDGIHGTLSATQSGYSVNFVRTTDGEQVSVGEYIDFIPERGSQFRNAIPVIWIGKNNLYSNDDNINDVEKLMQSVDRMLEYNASLVKRPIIITHFNNTNMSTTHPAYERVRRCNHLIRLRYKSCVFDVEKIILSAQIFRDLGIERTQKDIEQQTLGNLPPSLAHDPGHLSKQANLYIASKLADFIKSKNWEI